MISFEGFIPNNNSPIYQQIILYIKHGLAAGVIKNGDELPSRRALSALLGINPNTIQKSYHILEQERIISSAQGTKSLITANDERIISIRTELLRLHAQNVINAMKQMRVSKEEALAIINDLWEEKQDKED